MRTAWIWLAGFSLFTAMAPAQAPAPPAPGRIVSVGYRAPERLRLAPGQVITLYVHSPEGTQPTQPATSSSIPLPTSLNGYSVRLEQTFSNLAISVPLFSVAPLDNCFGVSPAVCEDLTAITIQVPWELIPNRERSSGRPENFARLTVLYQGVAGQSVAIDPQFDSIYVLNSCDSSLPSGLEKPTDASAPCGPLVTHVDGRLVTAANPAQQGETVVLYAYGLGASGGVVRTGDTTRSPVPLTDVGVLLHSGVNLPPVRPPSPVQTGNSPLALYAGLASGQVGLYQIALTIPNLAAGTPACTASTIQSNFTISVGRTVTFAGAAICVQP